MNDVFDIIHSLHKDYHEFDDGTRVFKKIDGSL